ncbi:MAG: N-acetyl-gamma-glutamyl-phosphate reductase [Fusobacteriaceae bacterium]
MIKVGIVGSTGYVGSELLRLLLGHQEVKIISLTSQSYTGKNYSDVFENFKNTNFVCEEKSLETLSEMCDVVFIALPHGVASKNITKEILSKTKIIDLGADFRFKDFKVYEEWYKTENFAKDLLQESVYGLVEINREKIKTAKLIGNPGCYTSCSILSLYPLLKEKIIETTGIIIDAKSGVSGAGRGVDLSVHFSEVNESIKPYKIGSHRHTPEIEEQLGYAAEEKIVLQFTPHLVPMNRGILTTSYARLKKSYSYEDIKNIYDKYYGHEYFIRLTKKGVIPETRWVKGSNFVDIGFEIDKRTGQIIVCGAIDNLGKGAASQAIQNMNLMFGLDEKLGINNFPMFP